MAKILTFPPRRAAPEQIASNRAIVRAIREGMTIGQIDYTATPDQPMRLQIERRPIAAEG